MSAGRLETRALGMRFQGLAALTDVSIDVPPGEIRGLIGPNGAGKTTFFNCLTGFYEPTSGEVLLDGLRVHGLAPHEASALGISRTFQNIRLFSNMTAIENVLVGGHLHPGGVRRESRQRGRVDGPRLLNALKSAPRAPRGAATAMAEIAISVARPLAARRRDAEDVARARFLLNDVGLAGRENLVARNLPYGAQRRLELARALATRPRLLLLDEPTAGMNPQESGDMVGLIRRIRDNYETTIVLIEHQMRVVMGVCDQITVLDYGSKIAEGSPAEIQHNQQVIEAYLGTRAGGR